MGNSDSSEFESQFHDSYSFVQLLDDPNFGAVRIYRKKQINFDYVMVYEQSLVGCTTSERNKRLRELEFVRDNPQEQVMRLFHFEEIEKNSFECKVDVIRMYIEYYNFTLDNLIENNARGKILLDYDEILYILSSIITVYLYFRGINANWFRIHPSQIFISTQGSVFFSPTQICRSEGDQLTGCITNNPINGAKVGSLRPDDPVKSYEKLRQLLYNLIQHHSLVSFQEFLRLENILDSRNSIEKVAHKIPKTVRTEIDMQKQIYREQSHKNSSTGMNMSSSSINRSFLDEKQSLKVVRGLQQRHF